MSDKNSSRIHVTTITRTLAEAMYPDGGLHAFNTGVYEGTRIPLRKMSGRELVDVVGTRSRAQVISEEGTWIADRFGELGARQIKRLLTLLGERR
jgi:hypothetical protein